MSRRRALRGGAVALLIGTAGLVAPMSAAPAFAAACTSAAGVTVVVDFNELGDGPTQGTCVVDGGGDRASDLFETAGFPLTYAQRQPGFVCRVSGAPQSEPCVNTAPEDAYWGLWWSSGEQGAGWRYSSLGVQSLRVPDGGLVAFAWDQQEGNPPPDAAASRPAEPTTPRPTSPPRPTPTATPTSSTPASPRPPGDDVATPTLPPPPRSSSAPDQTTPASPSASPSRGAGPTTGPSPSSTSTPSADPSADPSDQPTGTPPLAEPTSDVAATPDGGGVPAWAGLLAVLALGGAAGATAWRRRGGSR